MDNRQLIIDILTFAYNAYLDSKQAGEYAKWLNASYFEKQNTPMMIRLERDYGYLEKRYLDIKIDDQHPSPYPPVEYAITQTGILALEDLKRQHDTIPKRPTNLKERLASAKKAKSAS